jgi:hypothetical protein
MDKQKMNWWIDLVLVSLFWISFFPDFTGLELHQWLGIAAMALAVWHLIKHWSWVEAVTLRFFSRTSPQARLNYLVDAGVMLGFVMILLTGLFISTWLDLPLSDLAAWTHVHLMVSVFTLLLVVLKLVLHWRWVAHAARRCVFDPVFLRARRDALPRSANPVDRRDFLKVAGILGVATVATLHGLFDDTQQVQAESVLPNQSGGDPPQPTATLAVPGQSSDAADASTPLESVATQAAPAAEPTAAAPATACVVLCPNGCSYPGRCRRYVDRNGNNLCDNGECL